MHQHVVHETETVLGNVVDASSVESNSSSCVSRQNIASLSVTLFIALAQTRKAALTPIYPKSHPSPCLVFT
jgi:hypothetical protein